MGRGSVYISGIEMEIFSRSVGCDRACWVNTDFLRGSNTGSREYDGRAC